MQPVREEGGGVSGKQELQEFQNVLPHMEASWDKYSHDWVEKIVLL